MSNPALLEELRLRASEQIQRRIFSSHEKVRGKESDEQNQNSIGAEKTLELLKDFVAQILADNPNIIPAFAPVKGQARAEQKVKNDYDGDWYALMDAVRMTIIVPTQPALGAVAGTIRRLAVASNGHRLVKQKERRPEHSPCGYSDMNFVVEMLNGRPAEIQVNTQTILFGQFSRASFEKLVGDKVYREINEKLKIDGGLGHGLYEVYRVNVDNDKGKEAAGLSRLYFDYLRKNIYKKDTADKISNDYKGIAKKYPAIFSH